MTSFQILPENIELNKESILPKTPDIKDNINFNAFNSSLFISEYQVDEENSSENENKENIKKLSNSNIEKENESNNIHNSLEECLTNELIDKMDNNSNESRKSEKLSNLKKPNITNFEKNSKNILDVSKNLFFDQTNISTKEKFNEEKKYNLKKNVVYEENNNDYEFQLKFIKNSLCNILPKTYQKSKYNNYYDNLSHQISLFNCRNKFDNKINNNYYSFHQMKVEDNNRILSALGNNSINNESNDSFFINSSIYKNNNNYCNSKLKYQVHELKLSNSKSYKWKCKNCNYINIGYCKACFNCKENRKAQF